MKIKNAVTGAMSVAITLATAVVMLLLIQPATSGIERGLVTPDKNAPSAVSYTNKVFVPVVNTLIETIYGIEMPGITPTTGLAQLNAAGASWTRLAGVWWPDVEAQQGVRNWAAIADYDASLINAAENQLNVVLVVRGTPSWARNATVLDCGPIKQDKLAAFGDFMYALVQRYSVSPYNVKYYQLINEPDVSQGDVFAESSPRYRGCWGDQAEVNFGGEYYADMLKVVYPRMKQANPQAQLVLGGLLMECDPRIPVDPSHTGNGCHYGAQLSHANFLKGILVNGGRDSFDAVSFHAYDYYDLGAPINSYYSNDWNSSAQTTGPSMLLKLQYIKSVLAAYNVTGKTIMNTESSLGCRLCSGGGTDFNFETTKAFLAAQIYPSGIVSGLKTVIWFRSIDGGAFNVSMLNDDLSPRKAYTAFLTSRYTLGNGTYERTLTSSDVGGVTGVKGYSFLVNGQRVWTLWSTDGNPKLLKLQQMPASAKNMLGVNMPISPLRQLQLSAPDGLFAYVYWNP